MNEYSLAKVELSKQSIGGNGGSIGGEGDVDDEGDAKFFYHSLWDEDLRDEE